MQEVFSGDELCQSLMKEAETKSETLDIHFMPKPAFGLNTNDDDDI
jgi:hypothetical protein